MNITEEGAPKPWNWKGYSGPPFLSKSIGKLIALKRATEKDYSQILYEVNKRKKRVTSLKYESTPESYNTNENCNLIFWNKNISEVKRYQNKM